MNTMQAMRYVLESENSQIRVEVSNLGASLIKLECTDRDGRLGDVVVGPESMAQLAENQSYMGSTVGRFANRIARGEYRDSGKLVKLSVNDGANHLHGGLGGIHKVLWEVESQSKDSITFVYVSADGDDGYPGELVMRARYSLDGENQLSVCYEAEADARTPVNLAQHAYWNLTGNPKESIERHEVQSGSALAYLELNEEVLPTGAIAPSEGTVFDFTKWRALGDGLESGAEQIVRAGGYDHCLVFSDCVSGTLEHSITVRDVGSGRVMEVMTNMPGVQLYSGNFLDGSELGKGGAIEHRTGLCLETQHYPDAVNHAHFPSAILEPGEKYEHHIRYRFSTM
ncbi:aldose epimerase family protein [Rubritalea tangerina]|uniref:Aldose 1-epimerase n=1 Tax=Rubritalea tangerina TaxID=430798 RepID=A0ABW4ZAQ3_9BACT